jgi:hypothetical protein
MIGSNPAWTRSLPAALEQLLTSGIPTVLTWFDLWENCHEVGLPAILALLLIERYQRYTRFDLEEEFA